MKRILFCNEHIREKFPTGPVIAVLVGEHIMYTNEVTIIGPEGAEVGTMRFEPEGWGAPDHEVRVAIELTKNATLRFPGQS